MAKGWKCPRCSTANAESRVTCTRCGLLQGSVYVPTAWDAPLDPAPTASGTPSDPAPGPPDTASVPSSISKSAWAGAEQLLGASSPAADEADRPEATPPAEDTVPPAAGWILPGADQSQGPAAPIPLWRRIPIGWLVVGVLVLGGAISSWYFGAGRADTGEIAKPGDLTAVDLRVGDCFDLKDPAAAQLEDVAARPCSQEHEFELFFSASMPEGAYPAETAFDEYVQANCVPAFATYVGKAYDDSELDVYWMFPTTEAWGQGDHSIQCAVYHPLIHQLTGSLKGSNR